MFTNVLTKIQYILKYHPFRAGDVICNILNISDCVNVSVLGIPIDIRNGEVKIYIKVLKINK